jgi:hypothetical protein
VQACFPALNRWLLALPDPRCQRMCVYSAAHIWWHVILTYLFRSGSRHAFDQERNSGLAPVNLGQLCGQPSDDPRFAGHPTVTCSDNAHVHASRVSAETVMRLPLQMVQQLLKRRLFDGARLFDHWYVVIFDGTVQEKCRQGFRQDGKSSSGQARYRYVLQAMILGPDGKVFSFCYEFIDMHDPVRDKEDCELETFKRLAPRIKAEFPRLPLCCVADALYGCQPVLDLCRQYDWKYVLTLKEGRQPTTWSEVLHLLPLHRANVLRVKPSPKDADGRLDYRWLENIMLGEHETNVILAGEITPETATLYAYLTNFGNLTPARVLDIAATGRERHRIEDTFNAEKNHGIGLEHVFCADTNAAKNYYSMMQVAQILWVLVCHGHCRRVYDWARRAPEKSLAQAAGQALRWCLLPLNLPTIGQLRFGFG